jgi:hypothetical protein
VPPESPPLRARVGRSGSRHGRHARFATADGGSPFEVRAFALPTRNNPPLTSRAPALLAKEPQHENATAGTALLLADRSSDVARASGHTTPDDRSCSLSVPRDAIALATRESRARRPADERSPMNAIVAAEVRRCGVARAAVGLRAGGGACAPDREPAPFLSEKPGAGPHPAGSPGRRLRSLARRTRASNVASGGGTPRRKTARPGPSPAGEWMLSGSEDSLNQIRRTSWAGPRGDHAATRHSQRGRRPRPTARR